MISQMGQVMDSAEKASTEFPADKLRDEDHMADKVAKRFRSNRVNGVAFRAGESLVDSRRL